MSQKTRKADPMRTKNGKERLGPLNLEQLNKLIDNARPKNKAKIQRRIATLKKILNVGKFRVVETFQAE